MIRFSVATYNVHRFVGTDGLRDIERIVGVIRDLKADIVGLQEVVAPVNVNGDPEAFIANARDMGVVYGPTRLRGAHHFGNVLLTSWPILRVDRLDLSVKRRQPRGALDVDVDVHGTPIRVIVTHLGLTARERRHQVTKLLDVIESGPQNRPVIMMGDFNVWFPRSRLIRRMEQAFGCAPALRTYPSPCPILPLDRVWVRPWQALERMEVRWTPTASIASDHLPVVATVDFGGHTFLQGGDRPSDN